jgi:hypothetical protein
MPHMLRATGSRDTTADSLSKLLSKINGCSVLEQILNHGYSIILRTLTFRHHVSLLQNL